MPALSAVSALERAIRPRGAATHGRTILVALVRFKSLFERIACGPDVDHQLVGHALAIPSPILSRTGQCAPSPLVLRHLSPRAKDNAPTPRGTVRHLLCRITKPLFYRLSYVGAVRERLRARSDKPPHQRASASPRRAARR